MDMEGDAELASSTESISGVFNLQFVHSGKCLDVAGGPSATQPGTTVIQWHCWNPGNQQFRVRDLGNGEHELRAVHSDQCLDIKDWGLHDGADLLQWHCHGGGNQRFRLIDQGGGQYQLRNVHSGKCLDVSGGSQADGANVHQWDCHHGNNQRVYLVPVGSQPNPNPNPNPTPNPTLGTEFTSDAGWRTRTSGGQVRFNVDQAGAGDRRVAELNFPGNPALGPADRVGPPFASEIYTTQQLHFGVYRTRVQLARCAPHEDVVNGIFVYSSGGDANHNGMRDNNEIDIEILCGEPHWIWLSSWTDYDNDNSFRKRSRGIDMRTGEYRESPTTNQYGMGPVLGVIPQARRPDFPRADTFYEMGWDWQPHSIRFFIVLDGEEVTLWDLRDRSVIPQHPAAMMFNVWHPRTHWWSGGDADYPANNAVMRVDWFRYWAQ